MRPWHRVLRDGGLIAVALAGFVLVIIPGGSGGSAVDQSVVAPSVSAPVAPVSTPTPRLPALLRSGQPLLASWAGDAVTAGVGASTAAHGYRALMVQRLGGDGVVQEETVVNPTGTLAALTDLPDSLGLLVVQFGTAEAVSGVPQYSFRTKYSGLLTRFRNSSPDAVLLCTGVWRSPTVSAKYDAVIQTVCSQAGGDYVPLSDLYDRGDTRGPAGRDVSGGGTDTSPRVTSTEADPNDIGYAAIAARLLDHLGV